MTKLFRISLLFVLILLGTFFSNTVIAQATISIQSTLKNISGEAVDDGMQSITFKLYDINEGGSALWTETADVEVVSGIYSHELGSVNPLISADFGQQLYLGVTVTSKELAPRTKLGFAPYAMAVNSLAGNGGSAEFDGNGTFVVTNDAEINGTLLTNTISNTGVITSTNIIADTMEAINMIADTVTAENIAVGGATSTAGNVSLAINNAGTGIGASANSLSLYVNDINPALTIKPNGRVGIGTTDPEATLHVSSTNSNRGTANPVADYYLGFLYILNDWLEFSSATAVCAFFDQSIIVQNVIYAGAALNWSDSRIKTNLKRSNAKSDLALLNKIEITEYDHIDKVNNDRRTQKKVIAQQVEEVLPNAVSRTSRVIPNVYEIAQKFTYESGILTVQTKKAHDFEAGDKLDLKTPKKDLNRIEVISVVDAYTFTVEVEEKPSNIFVYGKYVDDFRSVDYDAIAMLNVSATQEMYRMILDLQAANKKLSEENKALKSSSAGIEDRLSILEAMLSKSNVDLVNHRGIAEK